mgnify:CR=1 FL=1
MQKIPFYVKITIFLLGLIAFFTILFQLQEILIPIVFAVIIAIVLHPVVQLFVHYKINRIVAIFSTLLITFIAIAAIGVLIFSQAAKFSQSWPMLVEKSTEILNNSLATISNYLHIDQQNTHSWVIDAKEKFMQSSSSTIASALMTVGNWLMILFLLPVYIFLILYYHPLLLEFIHRLFALSNQHKISKIISRIKIVIQRYLIGLVIEIAIVSTLNVLALLLLGVEYALLLGVLGGLLNLIPYIGGIISISLPIIVSFASNSSITVPLYVLALYSLIQIIDNNFIVPLIVSSKVKINALFSIIIVIAGNALWGTSGMFLSIPLLAITKVFFDYTPVLKPWGFLLGDSMPNNENNNKVLKLFKKESNIT